VSRRELQLVVAAGLLLSGVILVRIATATFVLGSPAAGWVQMYQFAFHPHAIAVAAIVWACCGLMARVSLRAVQRREWLVVGMWLAIGLLAEVVVRQLTPFSFEETFVSDGANGFYTAARASRPAELLADFDGLRRAFPADHAKFNMPGKVLLAHALARVSGRPDVQAWLVVVLSNLGGLLMYLFVRDFLDDRRTAVVALMLYLLVPSKLLFFPVFNTVTPVAVLACAWCWVRLLHSGDGRYAAALGACAYLAVFFEPTPSVMGLLFVVLTAYAAQRREIDWRSVGRRAAMTFAAFAVVYVVMVIVFRFNLLSALRDVGADAVAFNARVKRPYLPWIAQNLFDVAFGAGICQAVVFCWSVARAGGRLAALAVGTALVLLVTDLVGINRGEVVRLWIFVACFVQVPAAYLCARLNGGVALQIVLATTILQTAVATSMMGFAQP